MFSPKTIRFDLVDQIDKYSFLLKSNRSNRKYQVDPLELCFSLDTLATEAGIKEVIIFFRVRNIPITTAYDIATSLKKCVMQGIQIVAYSDVLTFGHLLAMSPCQIRCCPPLAGPLRIAFTLSRFWLEPQMERLGLSVHVTRSSKFKLGYIDFNENDIPTEILEWETNLAKEYLQQIVNFINQNANTKIDFTKNNIYSTAVEAARDGLLTHVTYEELLDSIDGTFSITRAAHFRRSIKLDRATNHIHFPPKRQLAILELSVAGFSLMENNVTQGFLSSLTNLLNRSEIKGLLLVLNHKGGNTSDADHIWSLLSHVGNYLPIVAYVKNALSAGYYIASATSRIVVNPFALSGAIGTIIYRPNLSRLLAKIGIKQYSVSGNEAITTFPFFEPLSSQDLMVDQNRVKIGNQLFQSRVAKGRRLEIDHVIPLSTGRIFSSTESVEYNLADQSGTIIDSLQSLQSLSGTQNKLGIVRLPSNYNSTLSAVAKALGDVIN